MASNEDDILYESNVTNGIKSIMVVGEAEDDNISDDLECPFSKELLLGCSLDEEVAYCFPEFLDETDMRNPRCEVGQLFRSM